MAEEKEFEVVLEGLVYDTRDLEELLRPRNVTNLCGYFEVNTGDKCYITIRLEDFPHKPLRMKIDPCWHILQGDKAQYEIEVQISDEIWRVPLHGSLKLYTVSWKVLRKAAFPIEKKWPNGNKRIDVGVKAKVIVRPYKLTSTSYMATALGSLLKSGDNSDVTLCSGEKEFPAHSLILAAHSQVFKAMLNSEMKEGKLRRVEIHDVSPRTLEDMLKCMYGHPMEEVCGDAAAIVRVMVLADKYQADGIFAAGEELLFQLHFTKFGLDGIWEMFLLGYQLGKEKLKIFAARQLKGRGQWVIEGKGSEYMKQIMATYPDAVLDLLHWIANVHSLDAPWGI